MSVSRRHFLRTAGIVGAGFLSLKHMVQAAEHSGRKPYGYGPLRADPDGILNLPEGFQYTIISRRGDRMNDGLLNPGKPDGMAAFPGPNGKTLLVRNHEVELGDQVEGPFGAQLERLKRIPKSKLYDHGFADMPGLGGTTTLVYDTARQRVESVYMSLAGTVRNCAGGPTPWNSWITCEETTIKAGNLLERDHGFNFEVPARARQSLADPVPLVEMGRFNHEAVAVDPQTGIVYQTEDRPDGLIYRYIPHVKGKLHRGGKLQVLGVRGQYQCDTRNWKSLGGPRFPENEPFDVLWIDIDEVLAPEDDLRYRGFEKGAACFARGEGMWMGKGEVYFACTNGGKKETGQIFRYQLSPFEGSPEEHQQPGLLELFAEPNNTNIVNNCDNLTMSPHGELFLCEDNQDPRIVGVTRSGEFFVFGHNVGYPSELSGGSFSPDGSTYFVNIQHEGLTLAITGPWHWS